MMRINVITQDFAITLALLIIAYSINTHIFLSGDVGWHIEAAKRLWHGGSYLTNLFDDNTLYTFIVFMPVIGLKQLVTLNIAQVTAIYIISLDALIFSLYYFLLSKYPYPQRLQRILYYCIVFSLLFLNLGDYAQREMIFITFIYPYLLLGLLRQHKQADNLARLRLLRMGIGLLAALAVMQNWVFIALPLCCDAITWYSMPKRRVTLEQWVFYCSAVILVLLVYVNYPEYFSSIIPLTLCLENGYNNRSYVLYFNDISELILLACITTLPLNKQTRHRQPMVLPLILLILSATGVYLVEGKTWYYHIYPALVLSWFLLGYFLATQYEVIIKDNGMLNLIKLAVAIGIMLRWIFMAIFASYLLVAAFKDPNSKTNRWIHYAKQHFTNKKIFIFSTETKPTYSLSQYSHLNMITPWSNCWLIPKLSNPAPTCLRRESLKIFYQLVIASLLQKPDYILIEMNPQDSYVTNPNFNYLDFLKQNPTISQLLDSYHYTVTRDNFAIFAR